LGVGFLDGIASAKNISKKSEFRKIVGVENVVDVAEGLGYEPCDDEGNVTGGM